MLWRREKSLHQLETEPWFCILQSIDYTDQLPEIPRWNMGYIKIVRKLHGMASFKRSRYIL
jgi:hypothetical protein